MSYYLPKADRKFNETGIGFTITNGYSLQMPNSSYFKDTNMRIYDYKRSDNVDVPQFYIYKPGGSYEYWYLRHPNDNDPIIYTSTIVFDKLDDPISTPLHFSVNVRNKIYEFRYKRLQS